MGRVLRGVGATIKWITILGMLAIVIAIIAVIISIGSAADESERAAAQVDPQAFASIETGDTQRDVRRALGKPESDQEGEVGIEDLDVRSGWSCWYWGVLAETTYQVCFEDARVVSKARY